ncbi:MAG TPA: SpoIID/LytB domain-containing protein [Patescibacteria group bacterium]|nr:SpoIID/LytB domain-containing protein [Patescibacteria group bacterium]
MKLPYYCCLTAVFFVTALASSCGGPEIVEKPPGVGDRPGRTVVTPSTLDRTPEVRVLIMEGLGSVRIGAQSDFSLAEGIDETPLKRFGPGGNYTVECRGDEIAITEGGKTVHGAPQLFVRPASDRKMYIGGKPYRGAFLFIPSHGKVITINVVAIDDYIKGVLPAEIGYLKPEQYEAYRAQAIASRSYALSKLEEKAGELYDLKATIMDQVYRGVQGEDPNASRAVDETLGLVALWEGVPARAYYSSCCGGHTSDIRVGWPWKTAYPYLYGRRDVVEETKGTSLCGRSPHFRWRVHWSGKTLQGILRKTLPEVLGIKSSAVGDLHDIRVTQTAPDGRVEAIEIETGRGTYRVEGDRIRWVLRPGADSDAILRSTLFKMSVKKARGGVGSVNLVGGGNGHGIGMCQTGAIRMAELGYDAEEILHHYFLGIMVQRYYR